MNGIFSIDTGGGVIIEGDTITAGTMTADDIICETLTAHDKVLLGLDTLSAIARVGNENVFTLNVAKALDPIFRFKFAPATNSNFAMTLSHRVPSSPTNGYRLQIGDQASGTDDSSLAVNMVNCSIIYATDSILSPSITIGDLANVLIYELSNTNIFIFNINPIVYSPVSAPRYQFRFSNVVNVRIEESITTFKGSTGIAVDNGITAGGTITGNNLHSVFNVTAGGYFLGTQLHAEDGVYFEVDDRMYAKAALGRLRFINEALSAQSMSFELGITIPLLIEPLLITHSVAGLFQAGCDFTTTLPTSSLTGLPSGTDIAPVNMLNNLYASIVTGGYARLTTVANAFTNNNSFNSNLPTSSLTGTPTGTQIAPVNMLNNLYLGAVTGGYARLTTATNTFANSNAFNGGITSFAATTSIISNAGATVNGTWTFSVLPFSSVDPTAAGVTGIVNWRTLLAQIATGVTNLKAAVNTWTSNNTFNLNINTLLPINYLFAAAQTYPVNCVGNNLNNQNVVLVNTGSANVYKTCGTILFPSSAYGMYLVFFKVDVLAPASSIINIGIGTTLATPLTQTIVTSNSIAVNNNFCVMTSMYYANTAFSQPIYGVIKSNLVNVTINSHDIRYVRVG